MAAITNSITLPDHSVLDPHTPILSIRPWWAYHIIYGGKDIENRVWLPNGPYIGPIYVHAGLTIGNKANKELFYSVFPNKPVGGVIGMVNVVGYTRDSKSRWAMPDQWHWLLSNPRPIKFVPMKGKLGFFYATLPRDKVGPRLGDVNEKTIQVQDTP